MTKRWVQEHAKDPYSRWAKRDNLRSRASFKLQQINKNHHVMRSGDVVVDLGAAPGGWSQVAVEIVGEEGLVVAVDLDDMQPLDGCIFIRGDATEKGTLEQIMSTIHSKGKSVVTVVISDMSPNISGNSNVDQANSFYLASIALEFARENLKPGGNFVCKIFQGRDLEEFLSEARQIFRSVRRFSPPASRKSSSEIYVIGKAKK